MGGSKIWKWRVVRSQSNMSSMFLCILSLCLFGVSFGVGVLYLIMLSLQMTFFCVHGQTPSTHTILKCICTPGSSSQTHQYLSHPLILEYPSRVRGSPLLQSSTVRGTGSQMINVAVSQLCAGIGVWVNSQRMQALGICC